VAKRIAAVSTEYLLREVGKLDDAVQLLPEQVVILTGLTRNKLRERMQTRPPQPPYPMPRERRHTSVWYSLGEIRRYLKQLQEDAAFDIQWREQKRRGFVEWLAHNEADETWPIALIGPTKRPVDFWSTLRGDCDHARN
jgi:hypothetical protein